MEDKNTNISRQNTEEKPSFECSNLQNKLSVKLEIGEELRRFYFEGQSFPELKVACLAYFNTADGKTDAQLQYKDDEDEWVTFSTDSEFQCALSLLTATKQKLLRLRLNAIERPVSLQTPAAIPQSSPPPDAEGSEDEDDEHGEFGEIKGRRGRGRGRGRGIRSRELHGAPKRKLLDARFVAHQTVPDNTILPPSVTVTKTWTVFNSAPQKVSVSETMEPVAPNSEVHVSVMLNTPPTPGLYQSYFKLITPEGKKFGQRLRCQLFIDRDATEETK